MSNTPPAPCLKSETAAYEALCGGEFGAVAEVDADADVDDISYNPLEPRPMLSSDEDDRIGSVALSLADIVEGEEKPAAGSRDEEDP